MKLIVALGNPGKKYILTPHNIGWMVAEALAYSFKKPWCSQKKWQAETAQVDKPKCLLVKPLTYMNLSGLAVKAVMDYYHLDLNHLVVIHDDTDLPFLSFRFQKNRGPAGHNGIKSIHRELGSQDYVRMRIGMAVLKKKELEEELAFFSSSTKFKRNVLKPFSKKELILLPNFLNKALEAILYFVEHGFEKTANRYNQNLS